MYDSIGFFEINGEVLLFESPGNVVRYNSLQILNNENLRLFQKLEYSPFKNFKLIGEYTFEKGFSKSTSLNTNERYVSTFKFIENNANPAANYESTSIRRNYNDQVYNAMNIYAKYNINTGDHSVNLLAGYNRE